MDTEVLYQNESHQWILFGRDLNKTGPSKDSNQYMVVSGNESILMDPGGVEDFPPMLSTILRYCSVEQIKVVFASHQDPEVSSSLFLWDQAFPDAKLHTPNVYSSVLRHFGIKNMTCASIPDEGMSVALGASEIQYIPAHYLHAPGNFHVYDPRAKVLMSGDVGSSTETGEFSIFVEDFNAQARHMKAFHQRWMPSNRAKHDWVARVRELDIDILAPLHGRIFKGQQVGQFLDWFDNLDVGIGSG